MSALHQWAKKQFSSFCLLDPLPEIPEDFIDLLLYKEEWQNKKNDQWGNWEHTFSKRYWEGSLWEPSIDRWAKLNRPKQLSLWPKKPSKNNLEPYRFAVCLTHDVDHLSPEPTFKQRLRDLQRANDQSLKSKERFIEISKNIVKLFLKPSGTISSLEKTLERSLRIEKECGVTASYFFTVYPTAPLSRYDCLYGLNDPVHYQNRKLPLKSFLKEIIKEDFDVGLHGSYYSAKVPGVLKMQKNTLEEAIDQEIITTRQHYLHWQFPTTLRLQEEAGFKIDSTLGFNRNIGYRAATGLPHKLYDLALDKESSLYELPLILQDGAMIGSNALELDADSMLKAMKRFIDETALNESCITLLFHPDLFADPKIAEVYRESILYAKEKGGWVTNLKEIYKWWDHRHQKYTQNSEKATCASI